PSANGLLNWSAQVSEGFAFVVKGRQRIAHVKRLKNVGDDVAYLLKTPQVLARQRGPLLYQTPPVLRNDRLVLFDSLGLVPPDCQAAFEFRHQSWFDEEVIAVLREHNAALCLAEAENELNIPFVATAPWGYVRLRRPDYSDSDLRDWAKRIADQA